VTRRERDLRRLADRFGWRLELRRGHHRLIGPMGDVVVVSRTPGDGGNLRVVEGCIKRARRYSRSRPIPAERKAGPERALRSGQSADY
jgi:hypothetical protein